MYKTTLHNLSSKNRNPSLDFLRGCAIILVLFAHRDFIHPIKIIGWIGVDLFFVLSGFLIGNILFKEYKLYGSINIKRFLFRRALKIYPLFYLMIILTILGYQLVNFFVPKLYIKTIGIHLFYHNFLAEVFFLQNYFKGLHIHTWSLALEEHYYIFISILLFLLITILKRTDKILTIIIILIFIISIGRIISLLYSNETNITATHLRIDGLLIGTLLSYLYNFNNELFHKLNVPSIFIFGLPISIYTILEAGQHSFIVEAFILNLLYLSFSILIVHLLIKDYSLFKTNIIFRLISKIGLYSYSIYLFHNLINFYSYSILRRVIHIHMDEWFYFLTYSLMSIIVGYLISISIEKKILVFRDTFFK